MDSRLNYYIAVDDSAATRCNHLISTVSKDLHGYVHGI